MTISRAIIKQGVIIISTFLIVLLYSCKAKDPQNTKVDSESGEWGTSSFTSEWKMADSLIKQGLPQSALDVVNEIYSKAKKENNPSQIIKASLYDLKLSSDYKEDYLKKIINKLNSEISNSAYPTKQILHSILAQVYWQYYQSNRYKFHSRSETINTVNSDIDTWDLKKILTEVINNYTASLEDASDLKKERLGSFDAILELEPGSKKFRIKKIRKRM